MGRNVSASGATLLADVRARLGISQADMARLLGLNPSQVGHAETGFRQLPAAASERLRAMNAALRSGPAPLPAPDLQPLRARLAQCEAQALRLGLELTYYLPARAEAASTRLGGSAALAAALAAADAEEPLPPRRREDQQAQLSTMRNTAHNEWEDRSGPVPQALLRARQAGLQAEAQALAAELALLTASAHS